MNPAKYIRTEIFKIATQREFGELLGYTQVHIARFEAGYQISRPAQNRIRQAARERGISWNNNWFFEAPGSPVEKASPLQQRKKRSDGRLDVKIAIDAELAAEAKEFGSDIPAVLEKALREELRDKREQKWREENKGANKAYNRFVRKHGLLSDDWRKF